MTDPTARDLTTPAPGSQPPQAPGLYMVFNSTEDDHLWAWHDGEKWYPPGITKEVAVDNYEAADFLPDVSDIDHTPMFWVGYNHDPAVELPPEPEMPKDDEIWVHNATGKQYMVLCVANYPYDEQHPDFHATVVYAAPEFKSKDHPYARLMSVFMEKFTKVPTPADDFVKELAKL